MPAAALVRQAQVAFRTRQLRKKAVRIIEGAWTAWQFHSEQANLTANDAEHAPEHAYHAKRRERAARIIQKYLQHQEAEAEGSMSPGGGMHTSGHSSPRHGGGSHGQHHGHGHHHHHARNGEATPLLYSAAELELLRRVQRSFHAHLSSQRQEAQEVSRRSSNHSQRLRSPPYNVPSPPVACWSCRECQVIHATRAAAARETPSGAPDPQYARLCDILRRCSLEGEATNLSRDEQAVLTKLQQAVRDHLERRRAAPPSTSPTPMAAD